MSLEFGYLVIVIYLDFVIWNFIWHPVLIILVAVLVIYSFFALRSVSPITMVPLLILAPHQTLRHKCR